MSDELRRLLQGVTALEERSGLRLAVIGGVARGAWATPRATMDVDVLAGTTDLRLILDCAADAGLVAIPEEVALLANADMTRLRLPDHPIGPVRLDLIAACHPFYERVLSRSRQIEVFNVNIRVASPEDLILLKLIADRPQDRVDVQAIIAAQQRLDLEILRCEAVELELTLPPELEA